MSDETIVQWARRWTERTTAMTTAALATEDPFERAVLQAAAAGLQAASTGYFLAWAAANADEAKASALRMAAAFVDPGDPCAPTTYERHGEDGL